MSITKIPYHKTGFYSNLIVDYLQQENRVSKFYNRFPNLENFKFQLEEKTQNFNHEIRETLVSVLQEQYEGIETSELVKENIDCLRKEKTFTITTGHQLNLFTGPLYFLYKIISAINLSEELNRTYPNHRFVPIYWMATEDHDFDEINFFNFKGEKIRWESSQSGAVGHFSTEGIQDLLSLIEERFGNSKNAGYLKSLFAKAYTTFSNLADATRFMANELFKEYGLVIIDADHSDLKSYFIPFLRNELIHQTSFHNVTKTNDSFDESDKIQVNPRDINVFYLLGDARERIVFENGRYRVLNTEITFSKEALLQEVENYPEKFSPNVLLRPLYQEVILPNLCYIGGGGELAYWLQLKSFFEDSDISFPILLLRNSVQIITKKQRKKLNKLNISDAELFLDQSELIRHKVQKNSSLELAFTDKIEFLKKQFSDLKQIAEKTDYTFKNAVLAQEKKQINGLKKLEKRLLKAEKRKHQDLVDRIVKLQNSILPNQKLEERQRNFSEYYIEYGSNFIPALKSALDPLDLSFTLLEL